jgi:hypothetical protein
MCPSENIVAHASDVHEFIKSTVLGHTAHRLLEKKPELEQKICDAVTKGSYEL